MDCFIEIINNKARHNLIDANCRWRSDQIDSAGYFWEPLGHRQGMQIRQRETTNHQGAITHVVYLVSSWYTLAIRSFWRAKMALVPLYTWSFLNLRTVQKAAIYITFYVLSANNGVNVFIKPHLISSYDMIFFSFEKLIISMKKVHEL